METSDSKTNSFLEEQCLDFPEFGNRLVLLLKELHEKRLDHTLNQRELNKLTMKSNEQERMLECERRSLSGLQMQLDMSTHAIRKKEAEAEVAVQKATRLEVQLTLANQEISVLRNECQKLELQLMEQTQKMAETDETVKKLKNFKDSCHSLQEKVKGFMNLTVQEMLTLKGEMSGLSEKVEKSCIEGVRFESAMDHYKCLKQIQLQEFGKAKTLLLQKQSKIDELEKNIRSLENSTNKNPLEAAVRELKNKSLALEKRLENEKALSKQLKEILSKAVQSQETLQQMEAEASSNLSKSEAKLLASTANEEVLKQEVETLRKELHHLEISTKKATVEDRSTQTDDPEKADIIVDAAPVEKLSETALSVQQVRQQFQSAITASGDDWSKYLSAFKN